MREKGHLKNLKKSQTSIKLPADFPSIVFGPNISIPPSFYIKREGKQKELTNFLIYACRSSSSFSTIHFFSVHRFTEPPIDCYCWAPVNPANQQS